jgi:MraZ protein
MRMLTGEFRNTLDEKGRISIPAKLREVLEDPSVVLTQGIDPCLWLFPPAQWMTLSRKLMESSSLFNAKARLIQRRILGPSQEVELDKMGRVSVPQSLREYAALNKECVILGISSYIEIWDAERYQAYLKDSEAEFREAAEEFGDLTLG